jgi:hypothetical protein
MEVAYLAKLRFVEWMEEEFKGLGIKELENLCLYMHDVVSNTFEGLQAIRGEAQSLQKQALRDQRKGPGWYVGFERRDG